MSGLWKNRTRRWLSVVAWLLLLPAAAAGKGEVTCTITGNIYFTNNTPKDKSAYPIELFSLNRKRRIASTRPYDGYSFTLTGIKPGKYLLKVTRPRKCVLWYRVDLRTVSKIEVRVIMDAACAHANGQVQDLPEN